MSYKIVVDSCCDFPIDLTLDEHFQKVALTLTVEDEDIVDDETFDQLSFIKKVAESKNCPKSSCPSPEAYMEAFKGEAENIYVVTLSANLSGSYNSAELGKKLYIEEYGNDKNIHIFDSCSASIGEANIALMADRLEKEGKTFDEIVKEVEAYKDEMTTYFVLESLETLRKNGRLTSLQAIVASVLNIKPVMSADKDGIICKLEQARGIDKALKKMCAYVLEQTLNPEEKVVAISHCNCLERAEQVKKSLETFGRFKGITIANTAGVATMYANDGGIIVAV